MNKYLILAATILTGAAVAFFGSANAEHHEAAGSMAGHAAMQAKMDAKFAEIDTNKNGVICMKEHSAEAARKFTARDTNKDGALDKKEIMASMHAKKSTMVKPSTPAVGGMTAPKMETQVLGTPLAPKMPAVPTVAAPIVAPVKQ